MKSQNHDTCRFRRCIAVLSDGHFDMLARGQALEAYALSSGHRVGTVSRERIPLPGLESDKILKTAATLLVAKHLRVSLKVDEAEPRHRFDLPG
jgi:hypothetical protein